MNKPKPVDILFPVEAGLKAIGNCPICIKPINGEDFRNDISRKEFGISGMCQKCQDSVFGKD